MFFGHSLAGCIRVRGESLESHDHAFDLTSPEYPRAVTRESLNSQASRHPLALI